MGEETAFERPALVSVTTTENLARAIAKGCTEMDIKLVHLSFHGGEPMMIDPALFDQICQILLTSISQVATLRLSIQTNGLLLTNKWLELFKKYEVSIGFSIDGDKEAHDRYRLSKNGRSTFYITEKNLKAMIKYAVMDECLKPATISVIDPKNDYNRIYWYLRSLGVEEMTFLLPDRSADDPEVTGKSMMLEYGRALSEIFEAWFLEDNPRVHIRHIGRALDHFKLRPVNPEKTVDGLNDPNDSHLKYTQILMARSDGTFAVNDTYIPALNWYKSTPVYNAKSASLKDFLIHPVFSEIARIESTLPSGCTGCKWNKICKGGDLENRYSEKNGFDNPSVYCEAYKFYYENMVRLLLENGYPADLLPASMRQEITLNT